MQPKDWSVNGLSVELKISRRTIAKRIADVQPVRIGGRVKYYRMADVIRPIFKIDQSTAAGDGEHLDGHAEKARLDKERADHVALKNKILRGEMIDLKEATEQSARNAVMIRNRFLALPPRLAQMLETTSSYNEKVSMIDREIREALKEIAHAHDA